ncbi:MAG: MFS transporter, partial [Bosea sp. (in: a-proteobacteria)]
MSTPLPAPAPSGRRPPRHAPLLTGLALTRIIGWGTTYWVPSVLVFDLHRDIGLSPAVIFGGVTVLLVIGALIAPALGRHFDMRGTRRSMSVGAVICALGLAALAASQGPVSYLASWMVIGIGHAMTLANVGNVTIAQLMGDKTRRVIGLMMVVGGLSSSIFWPVATLLTEAFGWRMALLTFAGMHLFIVLPIHLFIPRYRSAPARQGTDSPPAPDAGRVPPADRRAVFWL